MNADGHTGDDYPLLDEQPAGESRIRENYFVSLNARESPARSREATP
ncbi:MAG: hypothetical protein R3F31_20360 [Verrucomicrobiales bacterium]